MTKAAPRTRRTKAKTPRAEVSSATAPARPSGKLGQVVEQLRRTDGAMLSELVNLTGWQAHTVRAALTRLWPLAVLSGALEARPPGQARLSHARSLSEWIAVEVAVSGEAGSYSAAMALVAISSTSMPMIGD